MGAQLDEAAPERVQSRLEHAFGLGATILCSGSRLRAGALGRGHFHAPTVLANVTPVRKIHRGETCGPAAPVHPFTSDEEALEQAIDTGYGGA